MTTYVVIRDMSAGNESVGEMWKETKVFSSESTIEEVMEWATDGTDYHSTRNVVLTKAHE